MPDDTKTTPAPIETGDAALKAEMAKLKAENEALKQQAIKPNRALSLEVGPSGGIHLMGTSTRFGVTQYPSDWMTVLENGPAIAEFIAKNEGRLSFGKKGEVESITEQRKKDTLARVKKFLAALPKVKA